MKKIIIYFIIIVYLLSLKVTYLVLLTPLLIPYTENVKNCNAIIVLGGRDDYDRILKALEVFQSDRNKLIIFSGISQKDRDILKKFKIDNILFENNSSNTYENAKYTWKILQKKNIHDICLTSSQTHLFRAKKVFEKFRMKVHPIVSNIVSFNIHLNSFLPDLKYFNLNISVLYEYLALLKYKIKGYM